MSDRTIEIFADTRGQARCRGPHCGRTILWATVAKSGRKMCFDLPAAPVSSRHDGDGRLIEAIAFDENHWAHCPDSKKFGR
jgi:hypothetical protein